VTKPRARLRLDRPDQFNALLGSPVRVELLEALQIAGEPLSVAELARRTGRKPSALYHHLKKLVSAGIIRPAGVEKSGPRDQVLYQPVARQVEVAFDPKSAGDSARAGRDERLAAIQRGAGAVLRMAERDFRRCVADAAERGATLPRPIDTSREKAWLGARDLAELHRRLEDVRAFLRSKSTPGRGRLVALTISAAELPSPKPARKDRR